MRKTRKMIDCREQGGADCTLTISGSGYEVLRAAMHHAVAIHGYEEGPELRRTLTAALKDERPLAPMPGRKVADCSRMPSEIGCTLTISGKPVEVLETAIAHAVDAHGHTYSSALRSEIGRSLADEEAFARMAGAAGTQSSSLA